MVRAYKYRIYPNAEQREKIERHFGCCRWVFNYFLNERIELYKSSKTNLSFQSSCVLLTKIKQDPSKAWLREVNSQSLQASLEQLDTAFTRFFRNHSRFPVFKKKHLCGSFTALQNVSVNYERGFLKVPKIKNIRIILDRAPVGTIKRVTISRTSTNKYFASILTSSDVPESKVVSFNESSTLGLDLGLTHFLTLSTGEKIAHPKYLKKSLNKLKSQQRKLSKKQKGSRNYDKQRRKVARVHEQIRNRRADFLHKLSTRLVRENQAIAVEHLNVEGMMKNRSLSRSIADAGWSKFVEMLEYKTSWNGKSLLKIGRFQPSSKQCSKCGEINRDLTLKIRQWICPNCGTSHDRDINAATNIKAFALNPKNFIGRDTVEFKPVERTHESSLNQELVDRPNVILDK